MQEIDERILLRGVAAAREIRVIVVPIGKISERKFAEFFAAIKTFSGTMCLALGRPLTIL